MHIAIDNRLNSYRAGGISQYTNQLLSALPSVAAQDDRFTIIRHRKPPMGQFVYGNSIAERKVWTPPHHRWEQTLLPLELLGLRADILHFPDFIPLFQLPTPKLITVHDLAFIRYPEILDNAARRYYGQIYHAVDRADAIIAVSHGTRRDMIELLNVDPAKIRVIPEAAAPYFRPLQLPIDAALTINSHTLRAGEFALFVGTIEPRKNLPTLLHALHLLRDRNPQATPMLVIAGARGWLDDNIFRLVSELRIEDAVRFIGSVGQSDLVWLYNACRVYLHPELYSGFGLPIFEAMQCGAPVIAADTSSLPEVVGDAGLLAPPHDVEAWAETWDRTWQDESLRNQLRMAGLQQAAGFSWTSTAEQTMELYRGIAKP